MSAGQQRSAMEAKRAELRALEAEVSALKRVCGELPAPPGDAVRAGHQPQSEGLESSKDLRNHLEQLESELSFLSTLTGINIRKYSKKTEEITNTNMTEEGIKKVLQRHRLCGQCQMITFELEFQVLEIQNKENFSSVIIDLNIILEPTEYPELSEFVSRTEESRDLFLFFQSLHFFIEWCEYRKRTLKHFKEKYPEIVHLPEGASSTYMVFRSSCQPGFEFFVVWTIQINEDGKVWPKLDLLTKVPKQALQLDKKRIIELAPLSFRSLLGMLGIEAALECLVTTLSPLGDA